MQPRLIAPVRGVAFSLFLLGSVSSLPGCSDDAGGIAGSFVSEEQEEALGAKAWAQTLQQSRRSRDSDLQDALERVGERLVDESESDIRVSRWDFVVFEGDEVNAFALPGGHVGVYEGMFRVAQNDDQLAAVVGHEIAHVTQRHAAERIGTQQLAQLGIAVASTAAGIADVVDPQTAQALLGAGAQYGVLLPFSRGQELDADRQGLLLMARACYDPDEALEFWQRMSEAGGASPPVFLSTHPGDEDRIQRIQDALPEAREVYRESC